MKKFLQLDKKDQIFLFRNATDGTDNQSAILEKDFWVCWTLNYLFHEFPYSEFIVFKGGTCLSMVYSVIERFSEDIDLALSWDVLHIDKNKAYEKRSNRQQDLFNKNVNEQTKKYLSNIWLPVLQKDFQKLLGDDIDLWIDEDDPQTINFAYPRFFSNFSILQSIRLEIGMLAEPIPSSYRSVHPIISEKYPQLFDNPEFKVHAIDIYRTFFEKITILHREAYRKNGNYPKRYSRHFYDVYQLIQKGIGDESFNHMNLLKLVVEFKKKFYPCSWAEYDEVLKGNCKLLCNEEALHIFKNDYKKMANMIYGEKPTFEAIIDCLQAYEIRLNEVIKSNQTFG